MIKIIFLCIIACYASPIICALSATTLQSIQGHAPSLTKGKNGLENEIVDYNFSLFGFKYSGQDYYQANIDTFVFDPDVMAPTDFLPVMLPLQSGQAIDVDGDNDFSLTPVSTLSVGVASRDGTIITDKTDTFTYYR